MDLIFFEKQEGQLCAQHALNALLQGSYFMATDLAVIARRLDNAERGVYGQGAGLDSPEYLQQFQVDSQNMDDTGFFSVQVISEALRIWNLELVPYMNREDPDALAAQADPTTQKAYICNFREHWFTIRKIGFQWFNLNSMFPKPLLVSDTFLHMLLAQLQNEGYSIFVVKGPLAPCQADEVLQLCPAVPSRSTGGETSESHELDEAIKLSLSAESEHDDDVQRVLTNSRQDVESDDISLQQVLTKSLSEREEEDLEAALRMSLMDENLSSGSRSADERDEQVRPSRIEEDLSVEDLRRKRLAHLEKLQNKNE